VSPLSRHEGRDEAIINARMALYETKRSQNPERWSGNARNWQVVPFTVLNPLPEVEVQSVSLIA
jgi:hypothetical protein